MNENKLSEVMEKAQEAFWKTVAESFPEITSGDFPPDADLRFNKACKDAIAIWHSMNIEE
jgi:hypothetical protein